MVAKLACKNKDGHCPLSVQDAICSPCLYVLVLQIKRVSAKKKKGDRCVAFRTFHKFLGWINAGVTLKSQFSGSQKFLHRSQ
jgi:hypothetical protein